MYKNTQQYHDDYTLFEISKVEIIKVRPSPNDLKNMSFLNSENVNIVKLYMSKEFPIMTESPRMYLGDDYEIRKYGSFQGGLYFKIINSQVLKQHGDKKIKFRLLDKTYKTNVCINDGSSANRDDESNEDLPAQQSALK